MKVFSEVVYIYGRCYGVTLTQRVYKIDCDYQNGSRVLIPTKNSISNRRDIISISGGIVSTYALTKDGVIYEYKEDKDIEISGNLSDFLLNYSITERVRLPPLSRKWTKIACGQDHVFAWDDKGIIYAMGDNTFNQLGVVDSMSTSNFFIATKHKYTDIICGSNHSFGIKGDGRIFGWGSNLFGQLGISRRHSIIPTPSIVNLKNVEIHCDGCTSYAVSSDGKLFGWGSNEHGQLGQGNSENFYYPCNIPIPDDGICSQIQCNHETLFVSTIDGETYRCGWQVRSKELVPFSNNIHKIIFCYGTVITLDLYGNTRVYDTDGKDESISGLFVRPWIWRSSNHHRFDRNTKRFVESVMLLSLKPESLWYKLPKDIIFMVINHSLFP